MNAYDKIYINGQWVASDGKKTISVFDSTNEEIMATIPEGTASDVTKAAAAAKAAFLSWSNLPKADRAKYLNAIGDALVARMDEISSAISRETGMAKQLSNMIQVGLPINSFKQAAALAESFEFEKEVGTSLIVREPIGVVGCITPWNYPLHQIAAKVAFAMAAGCTVVLKPSEVAPIDAFMLAEIIHAAGLPAGVFNLVTGTGPVVGEAISASPDIDMISFTGSTRAGKLVMQTGSETVKKVALELGGKSANIIGEDLDEATFAKAIMGGTGVGAGATAAVGGLVLLAPVLVVGGILKAVNNSEVNTEIEKRQTTLPLKVAAGEEKLFHVFFPITPSPGMVELRYSDQGTEKLLVLNTHAALNGLHLEKPKAEEAKGEAALAD